jgi:hypothetical protein
MHLATTFHPKAVTKITDLFLSSPPSAERPILGGRYGYSRSRRPFSARKRFFSKHLEKAL